jgi:sn-glycerol 3-phosphate transport system permease protein
MIGVAIASSWQTLGLSFVIVLAGLQAIPREVEEASMLDGHGPLRRFFRVTLPLISPVLMFLLVILVVNAFQAFAQIDALTKPAGGPDGATETIVFKIFENRTPDRLGDGSIMSVGLFAVTFVVTLAQFLFLERRVHYGE